VERKVSGYRVPMGNPVEVVVRPVDQWQQRTRPVAFIFAVVKKYGDDRGGMLAALITFYGFLSLFPLLLVGLTVLALVAGPGSHSYLDIRNSALRQFPVVGSQLPGKGLDRSGVGLAIGLLGLVWGSLGVAQAIQFAVNEACDVPNKNRPAFVPRLVRSLAFLVMLAAFVLVSQALTVLGPLVGGSNVAGAGGLVAAVVLNVGLFAAMFKVLGPASFGWRDHFAGAVLAGVGWEALQFLGQYLVRHDVRNMTPVYGQFAVVLGLISFLSLASQLIVYAMELNTVRKSGLWPRSIVQPPLIEADRRSLESRATDEERLPQEHVTVSWGRPPMPVRRDAGAEDVEQDAGSR
jgi:YihY family inner membrane protein